MNRKTNKIRILRMITSCLLIMFLSQTSWSQIVGKWKTIDDETGKEKSIVQIWKADNGKYYGKITKLFDESKKDNVCNKCDPKDPRYKQKVVGMTIIMDIKITGTNEYSEGTILDPNNGKVYKCKIFRDGKNLGVRGYIAFLYRTQTWLPAE
jgi:uncharacterized protein (DUF2147 family)